MDSLLILVYLQVCMDKESTKEYILCEYNRDADSYRSVVLINTSMMLFFVVLMFSVGIHITKGDDILSNELNFEK